MAKKIAGYIKLNVPAGAANPSPPIGPALGQRGLNIMEFCKAFNARTAQMEKGAPIPVVITAYQDRSFTFDMKQSPVTFFLKKAAGLKIGKKPASGAKTPGRGFVKAIPEAHRSYLQRLEEHRAGLHFPFSKRIQDRRSLIHQRIQGHLRALHLDAQSPDCVAASSPSPHDAMNLASVSGQTELPYP